MDLESCKVLMIDDDELIASLSHDLKTPVTGIKLTSEQSLPFLIQIIRRLGD